MNYVLGRSRSVHWALVRSMMPIMFLSAFLNNTPCVTFMVGTAFMLLDTQYKEGLSVISYQFGLQPSAKRARCPVCQL